MIDLIKKIIDKLPKKTIKEIKDKNGKLYFKRNAIIWTPWFSVCEHEFFQDLGDPNFDKDKHLHGHPNRFITIVLDGEYTEEYIKNQNDRVEKLNYRGEGDVDFIGRKRFHRIYSLSNLRTKDSRKYCRTLVFSGKYHGNWNYIIFGKGTTMLVDHKEFQNNKEMYLKSGY